MEADATETRVRVCVVNAEGQRVPAARLWIYSQGWRADPRVTDADGCCESADLTEELEFTTEIIELPCVPVQVVTRWGTETQVSVVER